jgi:hypothetical protein
MILAVPETCGESRGVYGFTDFTVSFNFMYINTIRAGTVESL